MEANQLDKPTGGIGNCGTCGKVIVSGEVHYGDKKGKTCEDCAEKVEEKKKDE